MAEKIRTIPNRHGCGSHFPHDTHSPREIADQRLTRYEEEVRHGIPRAGHEATIGKQGTNFRPAFRPDFEIVLQNHRLPVEVEHPVSGIGL